MILANAPYSLKDPDEQVRRSKLLELPHAAPLADYVTSLRTALGEGYHIPDFDPRDGGVQSRILFLLEAPGPKAIASGFVSSNNPDPTAQNLWNLIHNAGIARTDTLIWNIVPWYVGSGSKIRHVNRTDIRQALPYLQTLLGLLPCLEMVVLVGRRAQSAEPQICLLTALPFRHTYHMSATVFNVWPEKKKRTEEAFKEIGKLLQTQKSGH